ncbi:hypothetical protein BDD43_3054 [Mucilaginibacter gracilis]|uniref:Uncharacterized protein n=1 Tax=Mucilaginibacter gracilis TaxID=423350 RepID=A0A495J228_9SPHI|nr:hypothetical protein [Mucilaginibacter gracilis]RKR82863.1 hypothetical protein BDD43_3054 [Mucilaginibacter gracilis]
MIKSTFINSELEGAINYLNDFFDLGFPKEHRKDLKKWRNHVINKKKYNDQHGAARVFGNYEETIQIIEVADICNRHKDLVGSSSIVPICIVNMEQSEWSYFPKKMSQKEILNPTVAIRNFFKAFSAQEYKDVFHEWLRLALSNKSAGETLSAKEVVLPYENLRKLYSALWLVYKRSSKPV